MIPKRRKKNFRDFEVFDFALYPRSKTRQSRKFRLPRILTLIVIQDLNLPPPPSPPKKKTKTKKNELRQKLKSSDII